jgi:hypothetical protein
MNAQQLLSALLEIQSTGVDLSTITLLSRNIEYDEHFRDFAVDSSIGKLDTSNLSDNRLTFV